MSWLCLCQRSEWSPWQSCPVASCPRSSTKLQYEAGGSWGTVAGRGTTVCSCEHGHWQLPPTGSQSRPPGLSLHSWTESFPRAQILEQAAVWSERAFSAHPVQNGKCIEPAASRIRLLLLLLLASQHTHTPRAWSLGFTSPSVCPSGPLAVKEACLSMQGPRTVMCRLWLGMLAPQGEGPSK